MLAAARWSILARALVSVSLAYCHNPKEDGRISGYAVAQIDEIDEISRRALFGRPVRFHFGITSFGVNAFTAHQAGDRLINEHDESQEHDLQEELYLVQRGRATFELDGERVDAHAGTLVFVRPAVKRTAFAEEPGTTLVALGGTPGKAYVPQGGELRMPLNHLYESGEYAEAADQGRELIEAHPEYGGRSTTSRAARASLGGQTTRSSISGLRSPQTVVACCRGQRLRPDPRRGRVQGAGSGQSSQNYGVTDSHRSRQGTVPDTGPRSGTVTRAQQALAGARRRLDIGTLIVRPAGL